MINALPEVPIEGKFGAALGRVSEYQRRDGTSDYCITPIPVPEMLDLCLQFFVTQDLACLCGISRNRMIGGSAWTKRHNVLWRTENLLDHYKGEFTPVAQQTKAIYDRAAEIVSEYESRKKSRDRRESQKLKSHKGFGRPT